MRHFILFSFILLSFALSAQNTNRSFILGGTISANYSSSNDTDVQFRTVGLPPFTTTQRFTEEVERRRTSVGFYPYLGRVINENITAGIGLDLGFTKNKRISDNSETDDNGHRFGGYLWLRYTVNPANKFRVYLEPQLSYAQSKGTTFTTISFIDGTGSDYGLIVPFGATYSLSERLLLNFRVGSFSLQGGSWKDDDGEEKTDYFNAGLRFQPRYTNFGVEFRL